MSMRFPLICSTFLLALVAAQSSTAAVQGFSAQYLVEYSQVSNAQPANLEGVAFYTLIGCDTDADATAGTMTQSNANVITMLYSPPRYLVHYSSFYPSIAAIMAAYPSGPITYNITAGNLAPLSGTLTMVPQDFPNQTPYLTGSSWSSLQLAPAGVARPVSWNPFFHSGFSTSLSTHFDTYDLTGYHAAHDQHFSTNLTSGTTIPAGDMESGHAYFYELYYYCSTNGNGVGMGGASSGTSYSKRATGYFKVKANPGTVSGHLWLGESSRGLSEPAVAQVLTTTGTVAETINFVIGYDGYYAFDTTQTGVRDIRFKSGHWLSKIIHNVDLGVGQDYLNLTLINGDADFSGEVDAADIDLIIQHFGETPADTNWNPDADLNGSLEVDAADIDISIENFGAVDE